MKYIVRIYTDTNTIKQEFNNFDCAMAYFETYSNRFHCELEESTNPQWRVIA